MVTDSAAKTSKDKSGAAKYVEVALPLPLRRSFTYRLRKNKKVPLKLGARLIVPFGSRRLTGYCIALHDKLDPETGLSESQIRDVFEIVDEVPLVTVEILELTKWAAGYYSSSWGEMLKGSLPAGINSLIEPMLELSEQGQHEFKGVNAEVFELVSREEPISVKEVVEQIGKVRARKAIKELEKGGFLRTTYEVRKGKAKALKRRGAVLTGKAAPQKLSSAQRRVIDCLENAPEGLLIGKLKTNAGVSDSPIKTLERHGVLKTIELEIARDPLAGGENSLPRAHTLTSDQSLALEKISAAIDKNGFAGFLLNGVTGSGKTEVYIRSMKKVLEAGRTALMMVPEIALTPVFSKQLRAIFGKKVAILHSSLSTGERYDEWRRIRAGEARVVIGTRSAVFAPLENLGLIVVDEEHETSYRQHEMPFYHGRDTAVVRAKNARAVVILGSATPALESFYNAEAGKYQLLELPSRISNRPMAQAELIDMREVAEEEGKNPVISSTMAQAIEETHSKGEQSMILLNRRGFSQFVLCRSCGESIKCQNCEITLTFHRRDQSLICHYCSFKIKTPESCPSCESRFLFFLGEGTEQVENILRDQFPNLRIDRLDRDSTKRKNSLERILERFEQREIDMLVGTQMIAKGHNFPNVTLVGVVSVDGGLSMPEFRSAERTFQLLTQVAGRAGRGNSKGRVLIQTFHPEHYALGHAVTQDYESFYRRELEFRRRMHYPPFVALGQILFRHKNFDSAFNNAAIMVDALKNADQYGSCIVLGPAPAPLSRLKGEYRIQILVKSKNRRLLRETIDIAISEAEATGCDIKTASVEIDPVNLL